MPAPSILGLDLPTFAEIRAAQKSLRFEQTAEQGPQIIWSSMNAWQDAITRTLSGQSHPSSDPNLSSLVASGWTWLGNTMGEPDVLVKKEFLRKREGKKKDDNTIERHRLYELLAEPNPYFSAADLWASFAYSWIIAGNVYWLKLRNDFGQVVQLWPESHRHVKARWVNDRQGEYIPADKSQSVRAVARDDSPTAFINYYEITRDSQVYRVERNDIVHFRDVIDPLNRRYGISKMQLILREIYGDSAVASYAAELLGGNGVIPYVLAIDDKEGLIGEEDLLNIKTKMLEQTSGVNAGKPLVITSRATVQKTGLTPQELDLKATRHLSEIAFSRVTGIPYQVLNLGVSTESSTFHNMAEADRRAIDQYLQPLWWRTAQTLTRQLLRDLDQDETHFVEFDLSEVGALQEDENEKAKRIALLYESGLIKRSEGRTEFNYEVDESDDVYFKKAGSETVTPEQEEEERDASIEAAKNPPEPQGLPQGQEPQLALVKGRHTGLLKGAPNTIKQLYAAK